KRGKYLELFDAVDALLAVDDIESSYPDLAAYANQVRATAFLMKGDADPAIESLKRAIGLCESVKGKRSQNVVFVLSRSRASLALAYSLADKPEEKKLARNLMAVAISSFPRDGWLYLARAIQSYLSSEYEAASNDLKQAEVLEPDSAE